MPDNPVPDFLSNPTAILGFGFIGLALLMAYLGYRALKEVIGAPNPKENVIKLARLFMITCFALLICAGPLQFGLLWAQSKFTKQPVNITISLANTTWQADSFGEVGIMRGGKFKPFSSASLTETIADGDEINVQLDKVISSISKMQAQILAISQAGTATAGRLTPAPPASDPANAALQGG